jgi:cytochrome oxidase Cu insertion factor (SCO1/SenC/PrrC family)
MSKPQKILTIVLWIVAVGGMVGVVAMKTLPPNAVGSSGGNSLAAPAPTVEPVGADSNDSASDEGPPPGDYVAPGFTLTDQDGKAMSSGQLLGHPWIADFFFTSCATVCPMMSAHMSELQDELPAGVKLVSFSVDPAHDTPAVLKAYGEKYHAQDGRWIFLTGDQKTQESIIRAMKLGFIPADGGSPIQHDWHFVLVDAQGRIRDFYDSENPQRMDVLIHDANWLIAHPDGASK